MTDAVVVVDTNVPLTANGPAEASPACVRACIAAITEITSDRRRLALDESWKILGEYERRLPSHGQPRLSDAFLRWVHRNRANPERCDLVTIRPRAGGDADDFVEFPEHPGLEKFDRADRKFVAVATAHSARPAILQGVDSKWWGWRDALADAGINVTFLCEADVREKYAAKFGKASA